MAKASAQKKSTKGVNKHLNARITYLHKAARYLAAGSQASVQDPAPPIDGSHLQSRCSKGSDQDPAQSRHLLNQMRGVSRKSQIRLSSGIKHEVCKRCDSLLVKDVSSTDKIENASKDRKKPWADVREIQCNVCRTVKRFHVGQSRQPSKALRPGEKQITRQGEFSAGV
jgi:ribonuclease P protein subunit RPR2